uniref:Uncharacterized protein n=1 Tax=Anguilla anguilla TaxID=7936 RepID=A0A0E9VW55_ANGAN
MVLNPSQCKALVLVLQISR